MNLKYTLVILIAILYSNCAGSPPPGHQRAVGWFAQKILLQSSKNLYVRLDNSVEPVLIADALTTAQADTFYFCDLGDNIGSLQAMSGKYIAANLAQSNQLTVHQTYIGLWEKFFFYQQNDFVVFQAHVNNLYIMPDIGGNQALVASSTSASNALCQFKIIKLP